MPNTDLEWEKLLYKKKLNIIWYLLRSKYIYIKVIKLLHGGLLMKEVGYPLAKFPKLAALNLTKLGLCEAGSVVKNILSRSYSIVKEILIPDHIGIAKILKVTNFNK